MTLFDALVTVGVLLVPVECVFDDAGPSVISDVGLCQAQNALLLLGRLLAGDAVPTSGSNRECAVS